MPSPALLVQPLRTAAEDDSLRQASYQQPSETAWLGAYFLTKYRELIQVDWMGTEEVCIYGSAHYPRRQGEHRGAG